MKDEKVVLRFWRVEEDENLERMKKLTDVSCLKKNIYYEIYLILYI